MPNGHIPPLETRLTLAHWFARFLHYQSPAKMFDALREAKEGWSARYHNTLELLAHSEHTQLPAAHWQLLADLDAEVRHDWEATNRQRQTPLDLKYFQYLACLSSALFLQKRVDNPLGLKTGINASRDPQYRHLVMLNQSDRLNKLAFWMATGSGKTLLMHMHYRQFLRHRASLFNPDNILLITPNEELSRQHIAEMNASGIPCFRHGEGHSLLHTADAVRVVEITKLVDEDNQTKHTKGKGESVAVEAFVGRNLIFVDEGHKGSGGEAWFARRDKLAQGGFVFEYSATFGQALHAARDNALMDDYARAILFDYSYRFFYKDGYGKDFSILNINDGLTAVQHDAAKRDLLMLGNLLAFFQQQHAYANSDERWQPYGIEKPLLLLLGATVTGKKTNEAQTDMVATIAFLHRVATNSNAGGRAWLQNAVQQLLTGNSGIDGSDGNDVFTKRFDYLQEKFNGDIAGLCTAMRQHLFHTANSGALQFRVLKSTSGDNSEIYLRVGDNKPFALIYVGSSSKLRDMVSEQVAGVEVGVDAIRSPLFPTVHEEASDINILIGARKFMEGWSSWRVSGMGLLNVGRSEGSQIIQLFGRGIRLKGKHFSLKRSAASPRTSQEAPPHLALLETLNIFAIRAKFMGEFRKYIQREGVEDTVTLPVTINEGMESHNLQTLCMPAAKCFTDTVVVNPDDRVNVVLDLSVKTQMLQGVGANAPAQQNIADDMQEDFSRIIGLLNFNELYNRLLVYKRQCQRYNLLFRYRELPAILQNHCKVYGRGVLQIHSYSEVVRLHQIAFSALRQYTDKLYRRAQKQWETKNAELVPLFDVRPWQDYQITVVNKDGALDQVRAIINDARLRIFETKDHPLLPRLTIDQHIYLPLLLEPCENVSITPPGLAPSEEKFVEHLRAHIRDNPLPEGKQVFLLRNDGKGRGVGFYEDEGFYPDFILWIKQNDAQRIIFVEPHGMRHAPVYECDHKAHLHEHLQDMTVKLGGKKQNITLDSYIISQTPYTELKSHYGNGEWSKQDFAQAHILFAEAGVDAIAHILAVD